MTHWSNGSFYPESQAGSSEKEVGRKREGEAEGWATSISCTRSTVYKEATTTNLGNVKLHQRQAYKNENAAEQESTNEEKLHQYYMY